MEKYSKKIRGASLLKIVQIVDVRSYGILEYAKHLVEGLRSNDVSTQIFNFSHIFSFAKNKLFHYSNSSYLVIVNLLLSFCSNNTVLIHDIVPRNKKYFFFAKLFMLIIWLRSKAVVVHSDFSKRLLVKKYPLMKSKRIIVIPHGVPLIPTPIIDSDFRKRYSIPKDKIIVTVLGTITKERGQRDMIEALFNHLSEDKFQVYIVGKNDYKDLLSIKKNIKNLGFVSDNDLIKLIYCSDKSCIFRKSSVGESSGVLTLCLALKKTVFASNVGSFGEILPREFLINSDILPKSFSKLMQNRQIDYKKNKDLYDTILFEKTALKFKGVFQNEI